MATIFIDRKPYEAKAGDNLLKACLSLGFDLPYFCWHPAMHSVGACRQCAVKQFRDENDAFGRIVMACMTPVAEGMYISVDDPEARKFRTSVAEWLMTNHPHDCPVCDEGGECHLQDVTVMTGHSHRRFRFKKRTHYNQDLGPFLTHEMNRCIACYRCTRFYRDYAQGRDFGVFASHNHVYFGRAESGTLESEFAGNLVEICPTGVFTDKTLGEHYSRPWDLQTAPSVCVHCSLGCNVIPGERYGTLRRIRNRYNGQVNGYFLCDRGRYGYEFVNSDRRILEPRMRMSREAPLQQAGREAVIGHLAGLVSAGQGIIGIGSPRASLEANFALRALVGEGRFYSGVGAHEQALIATVIDILRKSPVPTPSLHDVTTCDAVVVLGEDISNTAPILALNVLQSLRQKSIEMARGFRIPYWDDRAVRAATGDVKGPLFVATSGGTRLDGHATGLFRAVPDDIARVGFAVAHEIDGEAPRVDGLARTSTSFVQSVAAALTQARRPLVISGVSCPSEAVLLAAANMARSLWRMGKEAYLCYVMPECNSFGLGLLSPGNLNEAFIEAAEGRADVAIILENDLFRRAPAQEVDDFFGALRHTVVIDHLFHPTALKADAVLPAATFAGSTGTLVNNEGRVQRFLQVFPERGEVRASWRWLRDIMAAGESPEVSGWHNLDGVTESMARLFPVLAPAPEAAPSAAYRVAGMKIAREHQRYTGRTATYAGITVHEPQPPTDFDSPFAFSMEGYGGDPTPALIPRFWSPGWNSVQSVNKFQAEVGGPMKGGDPGKRLVEPAKEDSAGYFKGVPEAFTAGENRFLLIPFHHVFGSDELSLLTPGIRARTPGPYLALCGRDMARLGVRDGDAARLRVDGRSYRLTVRLAPELPPSLAALPHGVPQSPVLLLPAWAEVERVL